MTSLVTGANGFVGAAVVRALLARGETVRALLRPGSDRSNLESLPVDIRTGDIRDPWSVTRAVEGCDALFHVAADYRLWVPDASSMYRTNVDGTRNVIEAGLAAGVRRMIYTSSVATLGCLTPPAIADETTPSRLEQMSGHYKRSKFLAEQEVQRLIRERGAPVVIVNPSTPVGPGDIKPTPTGRMIRNAALGRMPGYVDTGLNIVHVDDVAQGHCLALTRGSVGERYILGGENLTLRQILITIAELVGRRPPRLRLPHDLVLPLAFAAESWARLRKGAEPFATVAGVQAARKHMFFRCDKARRDLGYAPRSAHEALRDAVHWFIDDAPTAPEYTRHRKSIHPH